MSTASPRDIIALEISGRFFEADAYADIILSALTAAGWTLAPPGKVAKACKTCNAPRAVSPCFKCGGELFEPADGWEWPALPPIDRIRELAREVGYAIGVHGSQERDLDLMALPWREDAVAPKELAEHIASGLGGKVLTSNDKHPGRWACNINIDGWYKLIDLSVAVIAPPGSRVVREGDLDAATEALKDAAAHLVGAASAYREHAARSSSVGRAKVDPFFTTRASDFDKAADRARAALRALALLKLTH